jgi:hypothetical protein
MELKGREIHFGALKNEKRSREMLNESNFSLSPFTISII